MLLFSLQVLPVKKIGKMLCKAQATEEVQTDNDDTTGDDLPGNVGLFNSDIILEQPSFDVVASNAFFEKNVATSIHKAAALPLALAAKIPSPPPEC